MERDGKLPVFQNYWGKERMNPALAGLSPMRYLGIDGTWADYFDNFKSSTAYILKQAKVVTPALYVNKIINV